MTIDINKVRVQLDSDDIIDHIELHANLKPILTAFLDRLEAAEKAVTEAYQRGYATGQEEIEKERDALRALVVMRFDHDYPPQFTQGHDLHELTEPVTAEHCRWFVAEIERLRTDCDALRAKIEAMEQQEPVSWADAFGEPFRQKSEIDGVASPLYALPGAQAQPAQKAVAYLDLGVGGYMDIGTDLTDEQLASLPKGRHMLGIVGTYGVDGYVSAQPGAQPSPSIPEGWFRAIDEALVSAHVGVASADDTYEQARAKLDSLLGFHVDVATDPAVNGGWQLVPVNPTETFYQCFSAYDGTSYSNPFDRDEFLKDWRAALAQATEAKT